MAITLPFRVVRLETRGVFYWTCATDPQCSPDGAQRVFFLSSGSALAVKPLPNLAGVALSVVTPGCVTSRDWESYSGYHIYDVSASSDLIAADRYDAKVRASSRKAEGVLLDASRSPGIFVKAILGSGFIPLFLVRDGKTPCGGVSGEWRCRDLESGRDISIPISTLGLPKGAASRIVISEYKKQSMPASLANALDLSSGWYTFKQRIVWDLDKQQAIAEYTPTKKLAGGRGFFAYSISPDGQYIADGSSDSVTLYKIP